jgi:hypothetical protein
MKKRQLLKIVKKAELLYLKLSEHEYRRARRQGLVEPIGRRHP